MAKTLASCTMTGIATLVSTDSSAPAPQPSHAERNARKLVGIIAEFLPTGGTCSDLLSAFQKHTNRERQTFFNCLAYSKANHWIVADGGIYTLNPNGSWREPPKPRTTGVEIGPELERHQYKHVLELKAERISELEQQIEGIADNGSVAVSSLVRIVGDTSVAVRRRLKAAAAILSFKVDDESIVAFAVNYLESICASSDAHIDHKIEAGRLLQQFSNPRVIQRTEYVSARIEEEIDPAERKRQQAETFARRKAHCERVAAAWLEELAASRRTQHDRDMLEESE
jgi:hypothetical protein